MEKLYFFRIKRAKFCFILLLTLSSSLLTLRAQSWYWGAQSTGGTDIMGDHAVTSDVSGNSYITGLFGGPGTFFGAYALTNPGAYDNTFIAKYDSNGTAMWAEQGILASGASYGWSYSVANDRFGNSYITGLFGDTISFGAYTLISAPNPYMSDVFITKYASNGTVRWAKKAVQAVKYAGGQGSAVLADASGNIYLIGVFSDTLTFGPYTISSSALYNNGNMFLVKYDSNGNVLWAKNPTVSGNIHATSAAIDVKGNVYVTGFFDGPLSFGSHNLSGISTNMFLVKFDSSGTALWAEQSNVSANPAYGNSVAVDSSGNTYVTGQFEGKISFGANVLYDAATYDMIFLTMYDANGNVRWAKKGNRLDSNTWLGYGVTTGFGTKGSVYVVMGNSFTGTPPFKINFGTDTFSLSDPSAESATVFLQFDTLGNMQCGNLYREGEDDGDAAGTDRSGRYVFTLGDLSDGTPVIFGTDTLRSTGEASILGRWKSCKSSEDFESISKTLLNNNSMLYPNPNYGKFSIQLANSYKPAANSSIVIYNMLGEKIYSTPFTVYHSQLTIDLGTKSPGVYLYRVITETGDLVSEGKFVIQ